MTEHRSPSPPAWVRKRDGRLVPFEADRISRALFAAGEHLGRPDAFLARELTDGIVHFLAAECDGGVPTTEQVADLAVKVVRELGQPALAQAFADHASRRRHTGAANGKGEPHAEEVLAEVRLPLPADAPLAAQLRACRRAYTLRAVFARDLAAVQRDGLLTLTGLETPFELAGCALPGGDGLALLEAVEEARQTAGGFVALDGPEYALAHAGAGPEAVAEYLRELGIGLRAAGLHAVVNLNAALPPSWADDLAEGPLFAAGRSAIEPRHVGGLADALAEGLLRPDGGTGNVRIDWHLGDRDFVAEAEERLRRLVRAALDGRPVAFVFDRPRRPAALAEGVDRRHPAMLLTVGLHLPCLAKAAGTPEHFVQKLGSLARLALSAAVQKRDFLRRHSQERPAVTRGFLLDRARLVVAPVGLDPAVRLLLGRSPWEDKAALDLARQAVARLADVLRQDGQAYRLETCLDGSSLLVEGWGPDGNGEEPVWPGACAEGKAQLRAAAALHAAADLGTQVLLLDPERLPAPAQVAEWLRWTWTQADVVRLRLVRLTAAAEQLTVPWPEEMR